ncbi:MAG: glycosyltransferase [Clostridiales bacterium]|nr:glycosyltransferase [Clostridiales bacterium]
MAKISVIVPVYNCEKFLRTCVDSVLNQSFRDFELILVNDGSTDGSGRLCHDIANRDRRVRVIDKANGGGAGEARNAGIEAASAPLISFLDGDDWFQQNMLEKMYTAQVREDYDLVICGYRNRPRSGKKQNCTITSFPSQTIRDRQVLDFFVSHFPEGMVGYPWNKLYKREILIEHDIRFPRMRRLEDGIFNAEYIDYAKNLCILEDPLYNYRASEQVEQKKLPEDFFDLMETFVNYYYGKLKSWGYNIKKSEEPIVFYFLNDFVCCLESLVLDRQRSARDRKATLTLLFEKQLTIYMLGQNIRLKRYSHLVIKLFQNRHWFWMAVVIHLKHFLKTRLGKAFQILKKVIN